MVAQQQQEVVSIFARHGSSGFRPRWSTFGDGARAAPGNKPDDERSVGLGSRIR